MFDNFEEEKPYKKKKDREMEVLRKMMENKAKFDQENSESDGSVIDWDAVDDDGAAGNKSLWADFPPVEKCFYSVKSEIAKMTKNQVDEWRRNNHDMKVDYVPKNKETAEPVEIQLVKTAYFIISKIKLFDFFKTFSLIFYRILVYLSLMLSLIILKSYKPFKNKVSKNQVQSNLNSGRACFKATTPLVLHKPEPAKR